MEYHIIAFFSGFLLDLMFGDPYWMPHPIRLIGSLIAKVEKCFLEKKKKRDEKKELRQGVCVGNGFIRSALLVNHRGSLNREMLCFA